MAVHLQGLSFGEYETPIRQSTVEVTVSAGADPRSAGIELDGPTLLELDSHQPTSGSER